MSIVRFLGLLAVLLVLTAFVAGCGGSDSLSPRLATDTGGGDPTPPGPPRFGDPGAEPGDELVPPTIPEDIVYDDSEPSGFLSCIGTDPETGEQYTAEFANDELEVVFDHAATLDEVDSAFTAIGAHKKRYMTWLSTWVAGLDTPAATCEELQAKVDLLKAQPKVVSVWKNQLYSIPVVP